MSELLCYLNINMASMDLTNCQTSNIEIKEAPKRNLRSSLRIQKPTETKEKNELSEQDEEEVKKIYLNKKFKRLPPSLETIFEEPLKNKKGNNNLVMSKRKFRRVCSFNDTDKSKKRLIKIRKLNFKKPQKNYTVKQLKQKLAEIEND